MEKYKIAVLDDDDNWCFLVERFFKKTFDISTFRSFYDLLRKVEQFDLIIVDFSIPPAQYQANMDGCEIIQKLKKKLDNPPIFVLTTGFITERNAEMGQKLCPDADYFLSKDLGLEAISQQIQVLLANRPLAT